MFKDNTDLTDLTSGGAIQTDVCIVGGGAAGIAIATELIDTPLRVVLLESGGREPETDGRNPFEVISGPEPTLIEDPTRQWYFGGNTNNWFGNSRPFDDVDFELRDWIPYSGWPISRQDLSPFYDRAQATSGLGDARWYDVDAARPYLEHPPFDSAPQVLATRMVQTPTVLSFADLHGTRLEDADNIVVLLHAHVVRLETSPGGDRVSAVEIADGTGRVSRIEAGVFILAAGGVENARLLLTANDVRPNGLGNEHDHVGRYFMEHWHFEIPLGGWGAGTDIALYDFDSHAFQSGGQGGLQRVGGVDMWGQLVLTEQVTRDERLPGLSLWFLRHPRSTPSMVAAARIAESILRRAKSQPRTDLQLVLTDPGAVPKHLLRRFAERGKPRTEGWSLNAQIEQEPEPENRVRLSSRRNRFGQPDVELDLSVSKAKRRQHVRSVEVAAEALGLNASRVARQVDLMFGAGRCGFYFHHMGTTRMADDATEGVVDANCRVHGVENLFVAGSSVFPTGATAAPTLTIVALAIRLADHIRHDGSLFA